jgi:hypothetical protein
MGPTSLSTTVPSWLSLTPSRYTSSASGSFPVASLVGWLQGQTAGWRGWLVLAGQGRVPCRLLIDAAGRARIDVCNEGCNVCNQGCTGYPAKLPQGPPNCPAPRGSTAPAALQACPPATALERPGGRDMKSSKGAHLLLRSSSSSASPMPATISMPGGCSMATVRYWQAALNRVEQGCWGT